MYTNHRGEIMQNHLKNQTSPYLLQHANNPVDWYPWCEEAFERAKAEDKPVFLSIGYSTCHWCHVMAHESFEDKDVAKVLNDNFVSIKVDKEERPDIDSIYMSVCQAFTGSGGWPTTIFMTPDQKPFFAGTYFPKTARYGQIGFLQLIMAISEKWKEDREDWLESANEIISFLEEQKVESNEADIKLVDKAISSFKFIFDKENGGFGRAPKFPTPHNLLLLMQRYEKTGDKAALDMVEKTLLQMYRGGIFIHIGGGFSRYSTDKYFLTPHFEKMLYDNALLILAYAKAYELTKNVLYRGVAEKVAEYIMREMTSPDGGFYSAQDADSEGVEGKYYLFEPREIIKILGVKKGSEFCKYFDITDAGNFEGKSIPNLLKNGHITASYNEYLPAIYEYRKNRYYLHLDDKILTSWNGLMIAAMCHLYRITENEKYLQAAKNAQVFVMENLCEKDTLFVSYRNGKCSGNGFLDDFANEIFALLELYHATFDKSYLNQAEQFCDKVLAEFYDHKNGGFFLYGKDNEQLILRPKETYDGAAPSGNSMMAYNLMKLHLITGESKYETLLKRHMDFMYANAEKSSTGHAMFLLALSDYFDMPEKITIVAKNEGDLKDLSCKISLSSVVRVLHGPTEEYSLKNDKTTFYVCKGRACLPPTNELEKA